MHKENSNKSMLLRSLRSLDSFFAARPLKICRKCRQGQQIEMEDLRIEISQTIKKLGIGNDRFQLVNIIKWKGIERRIADSFLRRGIRDLECEWWWEHLRGQVSSCVPYSPIEEICKLVPTDEKYYFVLEGNVGCKSKFWLYEGYVRDLECILNELHYFEYYVVSKKMEWILCENHHGVLIGAGEKMSKYVASMA